MIRVLGRTFAVIDGMLHADWTPRWIPALDTTCPGCGGQVFDGMMSEATRYGRIQFHIRSACQCNDCSEPVAHTEEPHSLALLRDLLFYEVAGLMPNDLVRLVEDPNSWLHDKYGHHT